MPSRYLQFPNVAPSAQQWTMGDASVTFPARDAAVQRIMSAPLYGRFSSSLTWTNKPQIDGLELPLANQVRRDTLIAFLERLRANDGLCWLPDWTSRIRYRGEFTNFAPELVDNGDFRQGLTGWTVNNQTRAEVFDGRALISYDGGGNPSIQQTVPAGGGWLFVVRCNAYPTSNAADCRLSVWDSDGTTLLGEDILTDGAGRLETTYIGGNSQAIIRLELINGSGANHGYFDTVSAHRVLRANGPSPVGDDTISYVQGHNAQQVKYAEGSMIEAGGQLHRLVMPARNNANGQGTLVIAAPRRHRLADDEPIILTRPSMLAKLVDYQRQDILNPSSTISARFVEILADPAEGL